MITEERQYEANLRISKQTFVERIEQQLVGAEDSSTRDVANAAYEQVVNTILDTLQQMAKLDRTDMTGTGDDKGQLNYFIIMIGEWSFKNACPIQAEDSCFRKHARLCWRYYQT